MAIPSFACKDTQALFHDKRTRPFASIEAAAMRKLAMLHRAGTLDDLRVPPGNQFEGLPGDRAGQYDVRINRQWRVCFSWTAPGPADVEIVDYH